MISVIFHSSQEGHGWISLSPLLHQITNVKYIPYYGIDIFLREKKWKFEKG